MTRGNEHVLSALNDLHDNTTAETGVNWRVLHASQMADDESYRDAITENNDKAASLNALYVVAKRKAQKKARLDVKEEVRLEVQLLITCLLSCCNR